MTNAYISGTGYYYPPRVVTNQDLVDDYGIDTSDEWIQKRTGIQSRHFADEGVGSAELGEHAAKMALDNAGITASDLDMILFATLSPDHVFPGSGVYLQARLGCVGVPAMDIRNQCSGFLYGLQTASALVKAGAAKHVLLVGAETHSAALDLTTRGRGVSSLFGDAAGAVVVSATEEEGRGIQTVVLGADGNYADVLCQKIWDISKRPFMPLDENGNGIVSPEMMWAHMDGKLVFKNAVEKMITSLAAVCWDHKVQADELDMVLFHQANLRINQFVLQTMGLDPERVPSNIERCGNTTAATIPTLLAEQVEQGKVEPGMKMGMAAFGSGFTWGAAYLVW
ncbi:MAG: beta-ketoacyl-ACP synthase III [Deltaproteobacteria bacterium]